MGSISAFTFDKTKIWNVDFRNLPKYKIKSFGTIWLTLNWTEAALIERIDSIKMHFSRIWIARTIHILLVESSTMLLSLKVFWKHSITIFANSYAFSVKRYTFIIFPYFIFQRTLRMEFLMKNFLSQAQTSALCSQFNYIFHGMKI